MPEPSRKARIEALAKTFLQVLAILGLAGIFAMILHKGYSDFTVLARASGPGEFWPSLLRYLLRNLAGG